MEYDTDISKEQKIDINHVFTNCSDEEEIFPPTVSEIAEEQINGVELYKNKKGLVNMKKL